MATAENGHALEGVDKTISLNEPTSRRINPFRWTVGLVVRLCIWYALLTPFFRCPSRFSELEDSSPRVCKPYLIARSHIEPHILPYYQTYGAPYVDVARPYVLVFNEHIYSPAANVAKQGYDKYGAPALDRVQVYGQQQWDAQVAPHLQFTQEKLSDIYKAKVDPYVEHAVTAVSPYYKKANIVIATVYGDYVLPFYAQSMPFIGKTYSSSQDILVTTVMPHVQSTWSSVIYFANSSLWPRITGLYSENVEPQLVKIGQRLASYREGKRVRTVVDEVDSTSSDQPTSPTTSVSVRTSRASQPSSTTSTTEVPSAQTTFSPAEKTAHTREKISSDLRTWQEKFAVAAGKGVEDLEERVNEIIESQMNSGVKSHGESLATALEAVVEHELSTIKLRISTLAGSLPFEDVPKDERTAQEELLKDIKQSAISIRERAHALREWYRSFDGELMRRVSAAVDSTLDVLDNVRDLGLQEIGMRWAWMDGVTYKDWAKYHDLKAQFDDWKNDVRQVGMQNAKIEEATGLANAVLAHAMDVAEAAAKELARLKDVGRWKISAREVSDNFDTRSGPLPALPKARTVPDESTDENITLEPEQADAEASGDYTEANLGNVEGQDSSVSWGAAAAGIVPGQSDLSPDVPEEVTKDQLADHLTASPTKPLHYISSVASSRLSEGLSLASARLAQVQATIPPTTTPDQNPILLDARRRYYEAIGLAHDHYSAFVSSASGAVYGSPTPTPPPGTFQGFVEDARSRYSQAAENWESLVSRASEQVYGTEAPYSQQILSRVPQYEAVEVLVSELLVGKEPAFADNVINQLRAIYETPYPASALSSASSYASVVNEAAPSAFSAYVTDIPAVDDILNSANEQLEIALEAASIQIYGTPKGPYEQATSAAATAYASASDQISEAVYGTEPGYVEFASSAIDGAFSSAGSAISEAIYTAPSSPSGPTSGAYASVTSIAGEQQVKFESATSKLGVAVESAQISLANLVSSASSFASEAVETAVSYSEELMHDDEIVSSKDEL
ncbi:hypothetical protein ASPWEDRAFT_176126 [Aspergillus wentii DTO 134E9]|uniref:Transcription factor hoxa13 n=1 Tax=Aspergillus wentii DTO 134E9 TaxID=1073089 RepID=A0A1L9R7X4_ASPWE|nr:uncharacterized protein ASPWEDRAFT_176126 [Aspergillus wentii DTO 134E9]KAI9927644.1 hypothetical protein MW887_003265 [Aspergillus wentii]OJJ31025.1 hypothetical protein ASPWEDRAFT_176126 [Aspergillus wentii DTO 134E9]